jgi:hypothetical protein
VIAIAHFCTIIIIIGEPNELECGTKQKLRDSYSLLKRIKFCMMWRCLIIKTKWPKLQLELSSEGNFQSVCCLHFLRIIANIFYLNMLRNFFLTALAKFLRVGSRVELVWLSSVMCDTGESHWCNTSCSRDMERITPVFVLQFILFVFFSLGIVL